MAGDLYVTRLTPTGDAGHPFDKLEIEFSQPIQQNTFSLDDVMLLGPAGVPIVPAQDALSTLPNGHFQLDLTGLTGLGTYNLTVGPNIQASGGGALLNQDHDATPGEEVEDAYRAALFSNGVTIADTNAAYDGQSLVFYGKTSTIDGTHAFSAVEILGGAVVAHTAATTTAEYKLDWTVTDSLWIDATSSIDVSARGYLASHTADNGTTGAATGSSGGSYGGLGANVDGASNAAYGDYRDPQYPGSGGARGGAGGGVAKITAATAQIEGAIRANGGGSNGTGAGSGGSISLHVGTLTGGGSLAANGGVDTWPRGSGGGGRIAVYYDDISGFDQSKIGALGGIRGVNDNNWAAGSHGSLYFRKNGAATGELRIDSHGLTTALYTPLGVGADTVLNVDRLVVTGVGAIAAPEHELPLVVGTVQLLNGGVLTHRYATATEAFTLPLTVTGTLTIDATSSIDVSARGYLAGHTADNGTTGAAAGSSGGSYGGLGANVDGASNAAYGDYRDPQVPGSGGARQGSGGGVAKITATVAQIDGAIRANGGGADGGGAGSGGSILLHVGTLSGAGSLTANGGVDTWPRGSGGGGRIAVYYGDITGFDQSKIGALGGIRGVNDNNWAAGSHGSLYFRKNGETTGELRIDSHGLTTALYTPLGVGADTVLNVDRLVVTGVGAIAAPEHEMPLIAGTVQLLNGGVLTHRAATASEIYTLQLNVAGELSIDADSRIDVTGRGYVAGRTLGNTTIGGATGNSGGSYGGLGRAQDGTTNPTYGDPRMPLDPGSGSGRGPAGGGVIFVNAKSAQVDGAIRANGGGGNGTGAGSGGSVLINVESLSGNGTIAADGGADSWPRGGGGGGRVAVYTWGAQGLPVENITARGGAGAGGTAQAGSVLIADTPYFAWTDHAQWLHGFATLSWRALGVDPSTVTVDVLAYDAAKTAIPLATQVPATGGFEWQTASVADGIYEMRATFRDADDHVLGEAFRQVTVLNALPWHSGRITEDETWTAEQVHIVDGDFTVGANAHLTIEPGTVVKFTPASRLVVEQDATVDAPATAEMPTILTSFADDSAGGDTNLDGVQSRPLPGDWNGFAVDAGGALNLSTAVDVRYMQVTHTGALAGSEVWLGTYVHRVTGEVLVPKDLTLTIQPGAVVKFEAGAGLTVQDGGSLVAEGTLPQPIVFTSVKDDAVGGDSNTDGDATAPAAGDWRSLRLEGAAAGSLAYTEVRYGGNSTVNQWGAGGMIESIGPTLSVENSRVNESLKDGIIAAGTATVTNSLVTATDRGVVAWGYGTVTVTNCTVDDNRQGVLEHGGTLTVQNSIVTNNSQAGVIHDWGTEHITVTYSDVWNPGAANYSGTSDKTDQNGNRSVDPKYKNRDQGNYRLGYRSPAIDAADGTVALAADFAGAPRYDDPRTANAGVPVPGGTAVPDMGAFEFVEGATSDVDLVVSNVSGQSHGLAGAVVPVEWTVRNAGAAVAYGAWHDFVYLSSDSVWSPDDALLSKVLHTGDLGPQRTYSVTAEATLPEVVPGEYYIVIRANSEDELFEGRNLGNNATAAPGMLTLDVPELQLGVAQTGSLTTGGQSKLYKLAAPAGADIRVTLDGPNGVVNELYAKFGDAPSRQSFDARGNVLDAADQALLVSNTRAGIYYVLVYAANAVAGEAFTLTASVAGFEIASVTPDHGSNLGPVTIAVAGAQFGPGSTVKLIDSAGQTLNATATYFTDSGLLSASFDLTGRPTGVADVQVVTDGATVTRAGAFQIVAGAAGQLAVTVSAPERVRVGRSFTINVEYRNTGDTDLLAPVIILATGGSDVLSLTPDLSQSSTMLQLLAVNSAGPAGILPPGAQGRLTVYGKSVAEGQDSLRWDLGEYGDDVIAWSALESLLRPSGLSDGEWAPLFAQLQSRIGSRYSDYAAALSQAATLLPPSWGFNYSLPDVFRLLVDQAAAQLHPSIRGRLFLDDSSQALGDVRLSLYDAAQDLALRASSLTDGTFLFPNVAPGSYDLLFDGVIPAAPVKMAVIDGDVDAGNLIVHRGGIIVGTVRRSDSGEPVPESLVSVRSADGEFLSTITGADGSYRLAGLPTGTYEVSAGGGNETLVQLGDITVTADQPAEQVDLAVGLAGHISGRVVGPDGGPVQNVIVAASREALQGAATLTAADGTFMLDGLAAGSYTIVARLDGFPRTRSDDVAVTAGNTTADVTLAFVAGGNVQGTLTARDTSEAVPFAFVTLLSGTTVVTAGQADIHGAFVVPDVVPGEYTMHVGAPGFLDSTSLITIVAGQTLPQSRVLEPAGVLRGTVRDGGGNPLPQVMVTIVGATQGGGQAFTDQDGRYTLGDLPLGTYTLTIGASPAHAVASRTQTLDASARDATVDFSFSSAGRITGRVFGDGATPLADVAVVAFQDGRELMRTFTDDAGSYALILLEPGTVDLGASAEGRLFPVHGGLNVAAGAVLTNVDFTAGQLRVQGTLHDQFTGAPIRDATVAIASELLGWDLGAAPQVFTGAEGGFDVSGLAPGTYELLIYPADHARIATTFTVDAAGTVVPPLTFTAGPAMELTGTVTDAAGQPVSPAQVFLYRPSDGRLLSIAPADSSGRYRFSGLAAGVYDVVFDPPGFEQQMLPGVRLAASSTTLSARLQPSTTAIQGAVSNGSQPLANVTVTAVDSTGRFRETVTTGADGSYVLTTLPPGDYQVRTQTPGMLSPPLPVTLGPGQTQTNQNLTPTSFAIDTRSQPPSTPPSPAPADGQGWLTRESAQFISLTDALIPKASAGCEGVRQEALNLLRAAENTGDAVRMAQEAQNPTWLGINADAGIVWTTRLKVVTSLISTVANFRGAVDALTGTVKNAAIIAIGKELPRTSLEVLQDVMSTLKAEKLDALITMSTTVLDNGRNITNALAQGKAPEDSDIMAVVASVNDLLGVTGEIAKVAGKLSVLAETAPILNAILGPVFSLISLGFDIKTAIEESAASEQGINDRLQALQNAKKTHNVADLKFQSAVARLRACNAYVAANPGKPLPPGIVRPGGARPVKNDIAKDPNDKVGPAAFGSQGYLEPVSLTYEVEFENDPHLGATIPAQEVFVTDALDEDLDLSTIEFGAFGFQQFVYQVPAGLSHFETKLDLRPEGINLVVAVKLDVDANSRELTATFRSLDPLTMQLPEDIDAGFLPVNNANHDGEGFFTYTVRPKAASPSGTVITNQASIVFDVNSPILTPETRHTLDLGAPTSAVATLPATSGPSFTVRWSGSDDEGGSGIAVYDVYVSDNGASYGLWKSQTPDTSDLYTGEADHTYQFYSVAMDNVGHVEAIPATFDAQTTVVLSLNWQNPDPNLANDVNGDGVVTAQDVLFVIDYINSHPGDTALPPPPAAPPPYYNANGDGIISAADALEIINYLNTRPAAGEGEAGPAAADATQTAPVAAAWGASRASQALAGVVLVSPAASGDAVQPFRPGNGTVDMPLADQALVPRPARASALSGGRQATGESRWCLPEDAELESVLDEIAGEIASAWQSEAATSSK